MNTITTFHMLKFTTLMLCCSATLFAQSGGLKLNQLQSIATHNSYKMAMDPGVMDHLNRLDSNQAKSLDYAHPSLTTQLNLGVLGLEIDLVYDPAGGRYSKPYGLTMQRTAGLDAAPLDREIMDRPGFKVLHVQDIDYRSSCPTFVSCLEELKAWSDRHPAHLPIMVSINAKEGGIDRPGFTQALAFTDMAFAAMEGEILSVLPADRLLLPDSVRGHYPSLREAVLAGNWPVIDSIRGSFFFVLDGGAEQTRIYLQGRKGEGGRIMFAATTPESAEAAVLFMNQPVDNEGEIEDRVAQGFIVRTRADAGTSEARSGDYRRLRSAVASGAHYISTDYEIADGRFGHAFHATLPGNVTIRCNPVTVIRECDHSLWEFDR